MADDQNVHIEPTVTNTYRTRSIAELLKISTSSVRKYALALEAAGAQFNHDEKGERLYDERDFKAFSHMRKLISEGSTLKEAAAKSGTLLQSERQARREAGEVLIRSDRDLVVALADEIKTLRKENAELRQAFTEVTRQNSLILASLSRLEALAEDAEDDEQDADGATANEQGANGVRIPPQVEKNSAENEKAPEPKRRGLFARLFGKG
ncbi:MerR family transcriptional regulator [Indiicoccus explosivorum]|uniref:MerR family transcriptional regulator n=1 Tax=Indiicoccus explosivorum TaxID=1917864 RepID=UPI000B43ECBA|nr:MerR family transcriptional regulator [Indiicoccus explosivorum]